MTKYSTPSIEVVNFNSSDATRIGMQWWFATGWDGTGEGARFSAAPANYAPLQENLGSANGPYAYTEAVNGLDCAAVSYYNCTPEAPRLPDWAISTPYNMAFVIDDGKSC